MVYNTDYLASNRDPLGEQIDGTQLRHRHLDVLSNQNVKGGVSGR